MLANIKAFFAAISAIKDVFSMVGKLWDSYKENKRLKRKEKIKESINDAVDSKDQRDFEKAIGSDNAGKPTKHRLDSLQRRKKDRSGQLPS